MSPSPSRQPSTPPADGPRERLAMYGEASLSDAELLAVLLGTGARREPVGVLAERLLSHAGGLHGLAKAGPGELGELCGIGPTKLARVRAALELGLRCATRPLSAQRPIRSSRDVDAALSPRLRHATREHFMAVAVDAKNRPLAELDIAVGGLTACGVSAADVFRRLLRLPAAAVIFAHNHPSGDPTPSDEDVALTERLARAGALLGVQVLDHLVLGHGGYFSFLDAGLMPRPPA